VTTEDGDFIVSIQSYAKLLDQLNRREPDSVGPVLVHPAILSKSVTNSKSKVDAMNVRMQRKLLGSNGFLLRALCDLCDGELGEFVGLHHFLRDFAPGLELLTSSTVVTSASLAPQGRVRRVLQASRVFIDHATFKEPLRSDLVTLFDFWLTAVPKIFDDATKVLANHGVVQQFELRVVPFRFTQDYCEKVHGMFRSGSGSTNAPTVSSIADTVAQINQGNNEQTARARVKRYKRRRRASSLNSDFRTAVDAEVNSVLHF
jgi:hypothetical protein